MLVVATHKDSRKGLVELSRRDLLHHTVVFGQSGSGKSFFVARLIEEVLVRTQARVVVVDPNGDFRHICDVAQHDSWQRHSDRLRAVNELTKQRKDDALPPLDERSAFQRAWSSRLFQYVVGHPTSHRTHTDSRVKRAKLYIHWENLREERDFLLDIDAQRQPTVYLGLRACEEYLNEEVRHSELPDGYGLIEVIEVAERFANRAISLERYPYVRELTHDDWIAVAAQIRHLYGRFYNWWRQPAFRPSDDDTRRKKTDLCGYLDRPFGRPRSDVWDACIVSLAATFSDDMMLAVDVALARLWRSAVKVWRDTLRPSPRTWYTTLGKHGEGEAPAIAPSTSAPDRRRPTFIVIDEAHNFAPQNTVSRLQERVRMRIARIAAEGRKYGLYLILATQRPSKLHSEIMYECENSCCLRIQSPLELQCVEQGLGLSEKELGAVPSFMQGQALMAGRWVVGNVPAEIVPARTVVAGQGLPDEWLTAPPDRSPDQEMVRRMADALYQAVSAKGELEASEIAAALQDFTAFKGSGDWLGRGSLRALAEDVVDARNDLHLEDGDDSWRVVVIRRAATAALPAAAGDGPDGPIPQPAGENLQAKIMSIVMKCVRESDCPVDLARAAQIVQEEIGKERIQASRWAGYWTFKALIENAGESNIRTSAVPPGYVFDPERHTPPTVTEGSDEFAQTDPELAALARRVSDETNVPYLTPRLYQEVFSLIADEATGEEYNLNTVSKSVRDRCIERKHQVSRSSINFIVTGLRIQGFRLDDEEPIWPEEIASVFKKNVLGLCQTRGIELSEKDRKQLDRWFTGDGQPEEPTSQ